MAYPIRSHLATAALGLLLACSSANAQIRIDDGQEETPTHQISNFTWADRTEFERWAEAVENIGQRRYGLSLRHDKSDLDVLQRIANDGHIRQNETEKLQGMGVILGNVLQRELGMEWKIYEDAVGRSRALCVPATADCLFPVTMLSRRLEVGAPVDVNKIYNDAIATIRPYLPQTHPYSEQAPAPRERPSWTDDRPQRPPTRIRVE